MNILLQFGVYQCCSRCHVTLMNKIVVCPEAKEDIRHAPNYIAWQWLPSPVCLIRCLVACIYGNRHVGLVPLQERGGWFKNSYFEQSPNVKFCRV